MIEALNLTAVASGRDAKAGNVGVEGVSFAFEGKGIFGVLCDSEYQRSSIAGMLCGTLDADGGEVRIGGEAMSRDDIALRRKVRLVPSASFSYGDLSPYEHLELVGSALCVESEKKYRQIVEAISLMGLEEVKDMPIAALSGFERCRLGIAAALIGNPEVIVIDSALDTLSGGSFEAVCELLCMLGNIKTIVLISSVPEQVKRLCERVAIIAGGKVVLCDSIAEIEAKINKTALTYAYVRGNAEAAMAAIREMEGVVSVRLHSVKADGVNKIEVEHAYDKHIKDRLFSALAAINTPMLSTKTVALTLGDVFYSFTSRATDKKEGKGADAR